MPSYRVYHLDSSNQIGGVPDIISSDTDAEAVILAIALTMGPAGTEIWNGAQLVCKVPMLAG